MHNLTRQKVCAKASLAVASLVRGFASPETHITYTHPRTHPHAHTHTHTHTHAHTHTYIHALAISPAPPPPHSTFPFTLSGKRLSVVLGTGAPGRGMNGAKWRGIRCTQRPAPPPTYINTIHTTTTTTTTVHPPGLYVYVGSDQCRGRGGWEQRFSSPMQSARAVAKNSSGKGKLQLAIVFRRSLLI